jgi:hypothetical protein
MQTSHELFIQRVAGLAIATAQGNGVAAEGLQSLGRIKLVYGAGNSGLRGITYFDRWQSGTEAKPFPFVEVCAFGQESYVQIAGTTIHELGHVLAGWKAGHSKEWKEACALLGLRGIRAAGTRYMLACFEPQLRNAIALLPRPNDGEPVQRLDALGFAFAPKPCVQGTGTRGGKSRGKGSGSRLRLYTCSCEPPVKLRCASDHLRAQCLDCTQSFERS